MADHHGPACYETFIVKNPTVSVRPSLLRNRFTFEFVLVPKVFIWRQNPDSGSRQLIGEGYPAQHEAYADIYAKESVSDEKIRVAAERALVQLPVPDNWRQVVIDAARSAATRACTDCNVRYKKVNIEIYLILEREYVLYSSGEISGEALMIPAADSSVRSLKKYKIVDSGIVMEKCCICLEDFAGGDEVVRMPCEHVFHGGCIETWLRASHYCPLCRFEMPTS